jgi:hypothetical protein
MYVKIHEDKRNDRMVVAVCDEELVGQEISEGNLNLNITERFYKGEKKTPEEVKKTLENASNINLVGKKAIKLAIDLGILSKEQIITIKNIPHAQIYEL